MTDEHVDETAPIEADAATGASTTADEPRIETDDETAAEPRPQYGVGPFSIREVALGGVWLIAFVVSFFSVASQQAMAQLLFGGSVWTNGLDWILTIGVPTVAVFLIVLRRFSPDGIRRVGSLGVDQFASVAFSVAAVVWLTLLWRNVAVAIESQVWIYGWVVWLEFFLMLAGVVLTVLAPVVPVFAEDFSDRREVPAHRAARPIRAVTPRPAREPRPAATPVAAETAPADAYAPDAYAADAYAAQPAYAAPGRTDQTYAEQASAEPVFAEPASAGSADAAPAYSEPAYSEPAYAETDVIEAVPVAETRQQAFWALVPEERDIVDERDVPIFRIGPTAWALVLEDRGEVFVVRHEDGRIGYLHDVSGVTRG